MTYYDSSIEPTTQEKTMNVGARKKPNLAGSAVILDPIPENLWGALGMQDPFSNPSTSLGLKANFNWYENALSSLEISKTAFANYFDLSTSSLKRRKSDGTLTLDESDKLFRMVEILEESARLFDGDKKETMRWLTSPNPAFDDATPMETARTSYGFLAVRDLIMQILHGNAT